MPNNVQMRHGTCGIGLAFEVGKNVIGVKKK